MMMPERTGHGKLQQPHYCNHRSLFSDIRPRLGFYLAEGGKQSGRPLRLPLRAYDVYARGKRCASGRGKRLSPATGGPFDAMVQRDVPVLGDFPISRPRSRAIRVKMIRSGWLAGSVRSFCVKSANTVSLLRPSNSIAVVPINTNLSATEAPELTFRRLSISC